MSFKKRSDFYVIFLVLIMLAGFAAGCTLPSENAALDAAAPGADRAATVYGRQLPGYARDVAIGGTGAANDDQVWMVEKATPRGRRGGYVCKWNAETQSWKRYTSLTGENVTVDRGGTAWVMDSNGELYKYDKFTDVFEAIDTGSERVARDIAAGQSASPYYVWIIDKNNGNVYQYIGGASWMEVPFDKGTAMRIDIDSCGRPWVVTSTGVVYCYDDITFTWVNRSATIKNGRRYNVYATDIGLDLNGWEVWITTQTGRPEAGRLYYGMMPEQGADPMPPATWYMGPDNKGMRLDASEGEIIVVQSTGTIWWVSLE